MENKPDMPHPADFNEFAAYVNAYVDWVLKRNPNTPEPAAFRKALALWSAHHDRKPPAPGNPLNTQVGGDHYRGAGIQPVEFIEANAIRFIEGCIIKRAFRHDKPTGKGRQDIEKIIHEAQLLLALRYGAPEHKED